MKNFNGYLTGLIIILISSNQAFSQANTSLSNLVSTTINQTLKPNGDNTLDLGSSLKAWKNLYLGGAIYLDDEKIINNNGQSLFVGIFSGTYNTSSFNTGLGNYSLSSNTTGYDNTACGFGSLDKNTTGHSNTASGHLSLYENTTGYANTANGHTSLKSNTTGDYNSAYGVTSLYANTTGNYNTAIGASALRYNTTGNNSTASGYQALYSNTTGTDNTASGYQALYFNTTGNANNASGYRALYSNTTGGYNTGSGYLALYSNSIGGLNTAYGHSALYANTSASNNTAIGSSALHTNSTGSSNTAIGGSALYQNSTGFYNTATGSYSLYNNTIGNSNTANGFQALYYNTTGYYNTADGFGALYSNTTAYANTATGYKTLYSNTTGTSNTANGFSALYSNSTGEFNTANGYNALYLNTTGKSNSANGYNALFSNNTGEYNTANGYGAGSTSDNSTNCTFIGSGADQSSFDDLNNSTAVGNTSIVTASDQVRIGNSMVSSIGGYQPWTDLSDSRFKKQVDENVPGIAFINKLKPVTYHLDVTSLRNFLGEDSEALKGSSSENQALIEEGIKKKEQIVYTGFLAQEVETAAKELGYDFSGIDVPQNEQSLYGLRYSQFVVPLVKAVQELDLENGKLKIENSEQQKQIDELKEAIVQLQSSMTDGFVNLKTSNPKPETLLGQNIPNPFDNSTLIPFRIPKDCNDASVVISESATGRIVRAIPVTCGETQLTLEGGMLASGTYSYSLIVDGKIIDSKQMELIK